MLSISRFTDIFRRLDLYHLNIVVSLLAPVQITWDLPNFYILSLHKPQICSWFTTYYYSLLCYCKIILFCWHFTFFLDAYWQTEAIKVSSCDKGWKEGEAAGQGNTAVGCGRRLDEWQPVLRVMCRGPDHTVIMEWLRIDTHRTRWGTGEGSLRRRRWGCSNLLESASHGGS